MEPVPPTEQKLSILIGCPSGNGMVNQEWVNSLLHTVDALKNNGHEVGVTFQCHTLVERARDRICTSAIDGSLGKFDYVLMIDADTGWDGDAVEAYEALMLAGCPVIAGGVCRKVEPIEFPTHFAEATEERPEAGDPRIVNGVMVRECVTAGAAFMAISTKTLNAIKPFVFTYSDGGHVIHRFWMQHQIVKEGEKHGRLLGEDQTFVFMCRNRGIPTFCPIEVPFYHVGHKVYGGEPIGMHLDRTYGAFMKAAAEEAAKQQENERKVLLESAAKAEAAEATKAAE